MSQVTDKDNPLLSPNIEDEALSGGIMRFRRDTLEKIHDLAQNEAHAAFFDALGSDSVSKRKELFDGLALAFMAELRLREEDLPKLKFLMELGYLAGKSDATNNVDL